MFRMEQMPKILGFGFRIAPETSGAQTLGYPWPQPRDVPDRPFMYGGRMAGMSSDLGSGRPDYLGVHVGSLEKL